jgi:isopentenyl-diphosphate delta-isomerase
MKNENPSQFETRKIDHVRIAMEPEVQTPEFSLLQHISLVHEALPEIDFQDVQISTSPFGILLNSPLFISSMTAGHAQGTEINRRLAEAAAQEGWMMGVGSQRKELGTDPRALEAAKEWKIIRQAAPKAILFGNLGLTQLIQTPLEDVYRLLDNLEASGLFIHTNPLQEVLQPEGTPQFRGGMKALEDLTAGVSKKYGIPVVLKEVGCGFSAATLQKLQGLGLFAVDVSGLGGTHWGRVETARLQGQGKKIGETFANWGISTVESLLSAERLRAEGLVSYQLWASGGVRSGLMAAKLVALGATMVGLAQPLLEAALEDIRGARDPKELGALSSLMKRLDHELKIALFCTGCQDLDSFRGKGVWQHD